MLFRSQKYAEKLIMYLNSHARCGTGHIKTRQSCSEKPKNSTRPFRFLPIIASSQSAQCGRIITRYISVNVRTSVLRIPQRSWHGASEDDSTLHKHTTNNRTCFFCIACLVAPERVPVAFPVPRARPGPSRSQGAFP